MGGSREVPLYYPEIIGESEGNSKSYDLSSQRQPLPEREKPAKSWFRTTFDRFKSSKEVKKPEFPEFSSEARKVLKANDYKIIYINKIPLSKSWKAKHFYYTGILRVVPDQELGEVAYKPGDPFIEKGTLTYKEQREALENEVKKLGR